MSEPDKVGVLMTPPKRMVLTAIEFKVCYWSCEKEPLHLDVFETMHGVPNGPPIAQSVCHHSDIVDEYAVFKFSEGYRMNEELLIDWGNVKLIYKNKKIIGVQTFGGVILFDPADPSRLIIKKR